jgi:hypothetical protein
MGVGRAMKGKRAAGTPPVFLGVSKAVKTGQPGVLSLGSFFWCDIL